MVDKVSSRKSGAKKGAPKYQNSTAFKHNKNSKLTKKIAGLPVTGLCQRCHDVIEWRKRYRKYKPLTVPKKCVACSQRAITDAYHALCKSCASSKDVCAKCQQPKDIIQSDYKSPAELLQDKQALDKLLGAMNERTRRSYLRKVENGDDEGAQKILLKIEGVDEADDEAEDEAEDEPEDEVEDEAEDAAE